MTQDTQPQCPRCGSTKAIMERRPNGDSTCQGCGFYGPSRLWVTPNGELLPTTQAASFIDYNEPPSGFVQIPKSLAPPMGHESFEHVATYTDQDRRFIVLMGVGPRFPSLNARAFHLIILPQFEEDRFPRWKDLYAIKNEVVGQDHWAYEAHPPTTSLIDEEDVYHLMCCIEPPFHM